MPIGLMREMPATAGGKSGDPIQLANDGVGAEMKQIDVLANRKVSNARIFFHDQAARSDPGQADPAGRMNDIAELFFEDAAPRRPRQQDRQEHEQVFQHDGASER